MERYRYFSTQRPVDIGTFPKPADNSPVEIINYNQDGRVWMEHDTILAWGELIYAKPLSDKDIADYELRPSRYNPDISQVMCEQAKIVGQWERRNHIPERERLTRWHPEMGEHVAKESVTAKQLAEKCGIAQRFPIIPQKMYSKNPSPPKSKRNRQEPDR